MKTLNNGILVLILLALLMSCDDILEEDITNDVVQTVFPIEGVTIEGNTVQFSWLDLDGADDYRIQIIKNDQIYVVDSLISKTRFDYILNPGNYQWRVRGENFAYKSSYTFPLRFYMEASDDLSDQTVALLTPSQNLYTNDPNLVFIWSELDNATAYDFELIKDLSGEQIVFQQTDISSTSLTIDPNVIDEDAKYIWKVKGVNETSETAHSQRNIYVDRVLPNQPTLTNPEDQGTVGTTVTFNWTNGTDSGNVQSTITNTIDIASDTNFDTIIYSESKLNNSLQYVFGATGTYYWRIKAIDEATNESDYSTVRSITVQ